MPRKRKVDFIKTPEDFKVYVNGKNPRARKMLKIFYELADGHELRMYNDSHSVSFRTPYDTEILQHQTVGKDCGVVIRANKSNRCHIVLDTGVIEIDDTGQMRDTAGLECMNSGFMHGSHGLEEAAAEFKRVAEIYKRIFGKKYITSKHFEFRKKYAKD